MKAPRKKCSEVYFTSVRTKFGTSLLDKLSRLLDKAGFGDLPLEKKYAAVKIHFGERGNLSFLRPNFARTVADRIKAMGGKPFGSPTLSDQALMPFPSLKMGPGQSSRSHTADEYIELVEIREAINNLTLVLSKGEGI